MERWYEKKKKIENENKLKAMEFGTILLHDTYNYIEKVFDNVPMKNENKKHCIIDSIERFMFRQTRIEDRGSRILKPKVIMC